MEVCQILRTSSTCDIGAVALLFAIYLLDTIMPVTVDLHRVLSTSVPCNGEPFGTFSSLMTVFSVHDPTSED